MQFYYELEGEIKSKDPGVLNSTKPGAPYQVLTETHHATGRHS